MIRAFLVGVALALCVASSTIAADTLTPGSVYVENCSLCHGVGGRGPANPDFDGPMLVDNAFIVARSDAALLEFLKQGRKPNAPDSQMHMLMPAFNSLGDEKLVMVVQFLRQLNSASRN